MRGADTHRGICGQLKGHPVWVALEPIGLGVPPGVNVHSLGEVLDEEDASPEPKLVCKVGEENCALNGAVLGTPVCRLHRALEAVLHREGAILQGTHKLAVTNIIAPGNLEFMSYLTCVKGLSKAVPLLTHAYQA